MSEINYLKPHKSFYKNLALIIFGAILFAYIINDFQSVKNFVSFILKLLSPFIIGGAIAFVLKIPMTFFEKKIFEKSNNDTLKKFKRPVSLLLSIFIMILAISLFLGLLIPQLIVSVQALEVRLPMAIEKILEFMQENPSINKILKPYYEDIMNAYNNISWDSLFDYLKENLLVRRNSEVVSKSLSIATSIVSGITNGVLAFVFSIYVLLDKERLNRQSQRLLHSVVGKEKGDYITHIFSLIHKNFFYFIKGQVTDAIIIGIMTFLSMSLLGLPYASMVSILIGFTDLVPIIGPMIGTVVGALFIVIESPSQALVFIIMMLVLQQIQGNIIYPKIVGDNLGLPSMWTIVATAVGGTLLGIVGMWIFIPSFAVIYALLGEFTARRLDNTDYNSKV